MEVLTTQAFKEKIFDFEKNKEWVFAGTKPVIVDFYADWCAPCRALAPVLEELAVDYKDKIEIYKVNTEATPELAALFGVRGIPALLFIPQTGEPAMTSGFMPRESLQEAMKDIFNIV